MSISVWTRPRGETAHDESSGLVDRQNGAMADIDEKAMRNVRLTALLLGLVITAFQIEPHVFERRVLFVSSLLLVGTIVFGVWTYDESELFLGPGGQYIEDICKGQIAPPWHEHLVSTYAAMATANADELRRNAKILRISNITLVGGVFSAALAGIL